MFYDGVTAEQLSCYYHNCLFNIKTHGRYIYPSRCSYISCHTIVLECNVSLTYHKQQAVQNHYLFWNELRSFVQLHAIFPTTHTCSSHPTWNVWCISALNVKVAPFSSQLWGFRNSRVDEAIRLSSVWYITWILSSEQRNKSSAMSSLASLFLLRWYFITIFCRKWIHIITILHAFTQVRLVYPTFFITCKLLL